MVVHAVLDTPVKDMVPMNAPLPSAFKLMQVIAEAQRTLSQLREEDGLVIETEDELHEALSIEGISVKGVLTKLGRAALDAQAYVGMISERMVDLRRRQDRAERRLETIRATLLQAMQSLELESYRDPEFSASVKLGKPKVVVTDVNALPGPCIRTVIEPDKRVIADYLAVGRPVPGAMLGNGAPYLTLKSK
jgi:Siphovirus Gp157